MSCCCEPNSRLAWAADRQASRTASLGDDEYASLVYLSGVDHEGGQQGGDLEFEGEIDGEMSHPFLRENYHAPSARQ